MRYLLIFFVFTLQMHGQSLYKGQSNNTQFQGSTGELIYKGKSSVTTAPQANCLDGIQNGDETGVDCGGSCSPCSGGSVPQSNFFASSTLIQEGQTVTFTNTSTDADTYLWTFTGSITTSSNLANPVIQYNTSGSYTVTLESTNAQGSDTEVKINYITVTTSGGSGDWTDRNIATPSYSYTNPTFTPPTITTTYVPSSGADLSNPANANKIAIISNSFNATGVTLASGQRIRPQGGQISGTNINLSDAYIEPNTNRAFASSARFTTVYDKSRVYPELFGAISNNSNDDIDAIEAAILNCQFLTATANGEYIINKDRHAGQFNPLTRTGDFDWDLNGATITTTNNSTFRQGAGVFTHQGYYLLAFADFDLVSIHNGECDGQDLASRFIDLYNVDSFNFDNLYIHDLMSPVNAIARAVAFNFTLFPQNGFNIGFITNNVFDQIDAPGDNIPNNSSGISKALSFSIRGNESADVFINNNDFTNITGDDAEAFYCRPNGDYLSDVSELYFHIKNNDFINCNRRAIKFDASNGFIENNFIENAQTVGDITQASIVQIFSIQEGRPVKNVLVRNNNIRILGAATQNGFFGVNDSRDIRIENNTFFADHLTVSRFLGFSVTSTQNGLYSGDLSNCTFIGNTITNGIISIEGLYNVLPGLTEIDFNNNTQNFAGSVSLGAFRGAINIGNSSLSGQMTGADEFRIKDHTINFDRSTVSTGTWIGVIGSNGMEPKNLVLDNVDITYTGSGSVGAIFGGVRSGSVVDYDSTNTILNCNITGASGTNSLEFNGSDKSVIITNSTGDGNTPITFNN